MHVMQAVLQRGQSAGPCNVVQTYFAAAGIIRLALAGSDRWGGAGGQSEPIVGSERGIDGWPYTRARGAVVYK